MPGQRALTKEYNRRIREHGETLDIEISDPVLYRDLMTIVKNHHEWEERKEGVVGLSIQRHSISHQLCLHLNYEDGRYDTISVASCVSGRGWTPLRTIAVSMRHEVHEQRTEYLDANPVCCACGNYFNLEVDHTGGMEFKDLRDAFVKEHGITDKHFHKNADGNPAFIDRELASLWRTYHLENAKLQTLCKTCHKAKTFGWSV